MSRFLNRFTLAVGLIALILLGGPCPASACSVCGCGDPLASSGTAHPLAGSFRLDFESIYLNASAASDNPFDTTQMESLVQVNLNTTLTFSPTDDLTLTAMLPLVQKYWTLEAGDAPIVEGATIADTGTNFGMGDLNLGMRYFFWQETDFKAIEHQALALSIGSFLPTGATNRVSPLTGGPIDTHAQLGTGAFGFYGGLLYNHIWDNFTLSANANVVYHTQALTNDITSPVYEYTFGTSTTGGISGQWKAGDSLAVGLAVEGRYTNPDTEPNPYLNDMDGNVTSGQATWNTPNTGGTVIDLSPAVYWNVSGDSTLYGKVQIPVLTSFNGTQTLSPTYVFGTQFLIH